MKKQETQDCSGILIRNAVRPEISKCEMLDCAFNGKSICHALAINVGDEHQQCDTFAAAKQKAGSSAVHGGVGACKVVRCALNENMLCGAGNIVIEKHGSHGDCKMFTERA